MQEGQAGERWQEITRGAEQSKRGGYWRPKVRPIKNDESGVARADAGKTERQQSDQNRQWRQAAVGEERNRCTKRNHEQPDLQQMQQPDEDRQYRNNEHARPVWPKLVLHSAAAGLNRDQLPGGKSGGMGKNETGQRT